MVYKGLNILLFCFIVSGSFGQPVPQVINTAGGSSKLAGGNYYAYNIGESVIGTTGHYFTQGFLQPDYKISSAFMANIYYGNESCQGANDGYIAVNVQNNKGSIRYSLISATSTDTGSALTNLIPGTYTLIVRDSIHQSVTKIINIGSSNEVCALHVHNAFSPNNDDINETFVVDGIENYTNNHVSIFNRWGQQVWDASGYNNTTVSWNGKDSNKEALYVGTYFYIIEINGRNPLKGWVEITK